MEWALRFLEFRLGAGRKRPVDDREAEVNFLVGNGQWRRNPEHTAHARELNNIDAQAEFQAAVSDGYAQFWCWLFAGTILHDFHSQHQSAAPHITNC